MSNVMGLVVLVELVWILFYLGELRWYVGTPGYEQRVTKFWVDVTWLVAADLVIAVFYLLGTILRGDMSYH